MSRVPRIRFKGFEEDWEQRKLGEMVEFYNGDRSSRYPNDSDMVFEGIPFINAGDLVLGRVKLDTANKITEEKYNQLSGAKIQCGDIIYCLRGTLGKNAFVDNFDIGTIASSLVDIRPQKIVGKYLFQVLNSDIEYSQRILNDEGAAQPNLSAKNLYLFDIPIPRDVEQIKIAEYLESLDHLITLHQRKLEKLKIIKKSMLENLFTQNGEKTPKIRFSGFTEDWEQRKLVNLCEKFTDGDWIEAKDQSHSGVRLIQTGNVGLGEYIDKPDNKKWISEETFVLLNCEEVLAGDILISRLPEPAGRACIVPSLGTKIIAAVDCTIVRVATKINPKYLLQYLSSQSYFDEVNTCLAGGTRQRISRSNLADFDIPIPAKYEEQKAIGEFLFCIDHLITLHQLEPFQLIFKAIAYRIIDYAKSKPPRHTKYEIIISFIKCYV